MKRIVGIVGAILVCVAVWGASGAWAAGPVKVVASFSILADMARNVGGDRVEVISLVGPNGDAHVFEPSPADAKAVSAARLVVVNGLGLEGWLDRLIKSAGYKGRVATASAGAKTLDMEAEEEGHGKGKHGHAFKIDPHAWQDLGNGKRYADNIAEALAAADPEGAAYYRANVQAYKAKLDELDAWVKAEIAAVPADKRRMITSHDALGYFAAAYGVAIMAPSGKSTESEASAGDIAALIRQIRKDKITAVFVENVVDPRLIEQIAKESGATVGGELYSDALSKPDGPAATYIDMFRNNVAKIVGAMKKQ